MRLCESAALAGCQRLKEHVARDCSGRFGCNLHGITAHSALYYTVKVAGGGPSVHACAVFFRAKSPAGDKFNQPPAMCDLAFACVTVECGRESGVRASFPTFASFRASSPGGRCHGWSGERLGPLGRARAAFERFASRDTSDTEKNPFSLLRVSPTLVGL